MSRLDAVTYISHGVGKGEGGGAEARPPEGAEEKSEKESGKKESALKQFTVDLNEKARTGKVDPLIGRMPEVERTVQILCRRSKNNPLYVGEPGVGKTAIAEGLARKIIEGDVPEVLKPRDHLLARHGRAARRHALPRRFRGAAEVGRLGAREAARTRSCSSTRSTP